MKRVTVYITGKVQQVGFRSKAVAIANALSIKGNVQNLVDGRVKIVAEGEEADLERFIQGVNVQNTLIYVRDIVKEYSSPTGDYEHFYKLVSKGETDERLDTAADLLKELIHVTKSGFDRLENKQDITIEKQDVMIEKQDVMIEKQDVMIEKQDVMIEKQDVMIEKQDVMIEKQDVMIEKQDIMIEKQTETMDKIDQNRMEIVSEIRSSRDDFKSHVDERTSLIEQDLAQIKAKVLI